MQDIIFDGDSGYIYFIYWISKEHNYCILKLGKTKQELDKYLLKRYLPHTWILHRCIYTRAGLNKLEELFIEKFSGTYKPVNKTSREWFYVQNIHFNLGSLDLHINSIPIKFPPIDPNTTTLTIATKLAKSTYKINFNNIT